MAIASSTERDGGDHRRTPASRSAPTWDSVAHALSTTSRSPRWQPRNSARPPASATGAAVGRLEEQLFGSAAWPRSEDRHPVGTRRGPATRREDSSAVALGRSASSQCRPAPVGERGAHAAALLGEVAQVALPVGAVVGEGEQHHRRPAAARRRWAGRGRRGVRRGQRARRGRGVHGPPGVRRPREHTPAAPNPTAARWSRSLLLTAAGPRYIRAAGGPRRFRHARPAGAAAARHLDAHPRDP